MQNHSDFFAFLAACAEECAADLTTSASPRGGTAHVRVDIDPDASGSNVGLGPLPRPGIEVKETPLSDADFALLGRALTFRRYAMESRGQARLLLDVAADYERQVSGLLKELGTSLAAKVSR